VCTWINKATKQNEQKRKNPKPEEHEGMPYCPPEERRGDRNPNCHEDATANEKIDQWHLFNQLNACLK
jgi:hypothetical protein